VHVSVLVPVGSGFPSDFYRSDRLCDWFGLLVSTLTRSRFAIISSDLCLFLGILVLHHGQSPYFRRPTFWGYHSASSRRHSSAITLLTSKGRPAKCGSFLDRVLLARAPPNALQDPPGRRLLALGFPSHLNSLTVTNEPNPPFCGKH
jgi:hypothetical protein